MVREIIEESCARARAAVDIVAGIRMSDENAVIAVYRQPIEQGADAGDHFFQCVRLRVEHKQIPIGNIRVLHHIGIVAQGKHIVAVHDMFPQIESADIPVDVGAQASRKLALIVGFEGDHIEAVTLYGNGPWVLGADVQVSGHRARRNIDDGDSIGSGKCHIRLVVVGEGNAHGFVKAGGEGLGIDVLNSGDHLLEGRTGWIGVDIESLRDRWHERLKIDQHMPPRAVERLPKIETCDSLGAAGGLVEGSELTRARPFLATHTKTGCAE